MRITQLTVAEAFASLRSTERGLDSAEAARRFAEYGPNRVEEIRGEPLALRFAREFTHFFAFILWLAAGLAFLAEHYDPGKGMATLGYAIIGVIVVNGVFSFWQEYRAERAIAALKDLLPHQVTVVRDGLDCRLPAESLVPGDLILAIVYTSWGQLIFGTAALPLDAWLFMLPFAAAMLLLEEARKFLTRRALARWD
jgi:sodium/potassium-transporting ATPase subunit alpha